MMHIVNFSLNSMLLIWYQDSFLWMFLNRNIRFYMYSCCQTNHACCFYISAETYFLKRAMYSNSLLIRLMVLIVVSNIEYFCKIYKYKSE